MPERIPQSDTANQQSMSQANSSKPTLKNTQGSPYQTKAGKLGPIQARWNGKPLTSPQAKQIPINASANALEPVQKQDDTKKDKKKKLPQTTGSQNSLPTQLKENMEAMSGTDLSDVTVNYNSPKPKEMGALAYAQGNKIEIGPGQEKHLPHEAWHTVQQKQGRVQPNAQVQAKGLPLNDDPTLEKEADVMGEKAVQMKTISQQGQINASLSPPQNTPVQLKINAERFQEDEKIASIDQGNLVLGAESVDLVVRKIQQALVDLGYLTPDQVDGKYGGNTYKAVENFQQAEGLSVDGEVGQDTMRSLDQKFANFAPEAQIGKSEDQNALLAGTRELDEQDRKAIASIISTEVKVNPKTGEKPQFVNKVEGKTYKERLLKRTEAIIEDQYNRLGKGKAEARKNPNNLHSWSTIEGLAEVSKAKTDAIFGDYNSGDPLKANQELFDGWEDKVRQFNTRGPGYTNSKTKWRVQKIVQSSRVKAINEKHGADQSQDPAKSIVTQVINELAIKHKDKLIETHKGWGGYASAGNIYLQRYKSSDNAKNRLYMWKYFRTIIHEYLHTLEHDDHKHYSHGLGEKQGGKTLREGVVDYFTNVVWGSLSVDKTLQEAVEGPYYDENEDIKLPRFGVYPEAQNAARLAGLVGFRNVCAAFFLGKTELIGKT